MTFINIKYEDTMIHEGLEVQTVPRIGETMCVGDTYASIINVIHGGTWGNSSPTIVLARCYAFEPFEFNGEPIVEGQVLSGEQLLEYINQRRKRRAR